MYIFFILVHHSLDEIELVQLSPTVPPPHISWQLLMIRQRVYENKSLFIGIIKVPIKKHTIKLLLLVVVVVVVAQW